MSSPIVTSLLTLPSSKILFPWKAYILKPGVGVSLAALVTYCWYACSKIFCPSNFPCKYLKWYIGYYHLIVWQECYDMPNFPRQLSKHYNTSKWLGTKHNMKLGIGGIIGHICNVTLVRMFKNVIWITPNFSGMINVLDISEKYSVNARHTSYDSGFVSSPQPMYQNL